MEHLEVPLPDDNIPPAPVEQCDQALALLSGPPIQGPDSRQQRRLPSWWGIADERSRFLNCLHALQEATVVLIADFVEDMSLPVNSYTELRHGLWAVHQLMDIQRLEQLITYRLSPPRSLQSSSTKMLRLCPIAPLHPCTNKAMTFIVFIAGIFWPFL
jgi:hypothetical protein